MVPARAPRPLPLPAERYKRPAVCDSQLLRAVAGPACKGRGSRDGCNKMPRTATLRAALPSQLAHPHTLRML